MSDSYDVLAADGSVLQYRADQFSEFTEARSREQHDKLVADGWLALDERIETGEMPEHPSALEEAFTEHVVPARACTAHHGVHPRAPQARGRGRLRSSEERGARARRRRRSRRAEYRYDRRHTIELSIG